MLGWAQKADDIVSKARNAEKQKRAQAVFELIRDAEF
jgi:hypothetical protein